MNGSPAAGAAIGIIGMGRMGARLADAAASSGCRIVATLDHTTQPLALTEQPTLADVFTTDAARFWDTKMDAVAIATTAPHHVPLLEQGLSHGIRRFVVEKPFCTGVAEGEAAQAAANGAGARVAVNHGRRYCPNYAALAALDGAPAMGALRAISVTLGAGGLGCLGVHYLDLFNRLFGGLPETVTAVMGGETPANPRGTEFDDPGACALMVWPDDRRALLDMSDDAGIPPFMEFRFTYGRVVIENESKPWRILCRDEADRAQPLTRYGTPNREIAMPKFRSFGIIDMAASALTDALSDGPVISGIAPALDAIRVFAAIREAGETGTMARLPLGETTRTRAFAIP